MRRPALLALALAAVLLGGCSDAVDPTLGTEQAFSLYGYLDPTADRQAVRVVPITHTLEADTAAVLDVVVTSTEPATGRTATWRDSVVTYIDGSRGHVFVADYTPTAGTTVEVRVDEQTGERRAATVSVAVPEVVRPEIGTVDVSGGEVTYPIRLAAPRVLSTALVYHVLGWPEAPTDTVAVRYPGAAPLAEVGAGAWGLDLLFLQTSRAFLASREVGGARLKLVAVSLEAFVGDAAWAVPPGGFDLDAIVEPGTFSNVAGGFGFVGAGYWTGVRWEPSLTTQSRAGFLIEEDPASSLFLNEVSGTGWIELYNPTLEAIPIGGYTAASGDDVATLPFGTTVAPGGFLQVTVGAGLSGDEAELIAPGGERVLGLSLGSLPANGLTTFGSYPDGRSRTAVLLRDPRDPTLVFRNVDIFRGVLAPTPGAPNRLAATLAVVNEVFSAGPAGWVELLRLPGLSDAFVSSDEALPVDQWAHVRFAGSPLAVADEAGGHLELEQVGGEVLVGVWIHETPPRVVDVRAYGPQAPERSSGLLPDGDISGWRTGLLPTRGAPNAAARFAH